MRLPLIDRISHAELSSRVHVPYAYLSLNAELIQRKREERERERMGRSRQRRKREERIENREGRETGKDTDR
jgi:hypothetical protein